MSIFEPTSISYEFYRELFSQLSANHLLADLGHCPYIKDMDGTMYTNYRNYLMEMVRDSQTPSEK